ncbi:lysophospholipid acyltransferase family protein [Paracoccaceae bacterium GXU_MW_L88]
MQTRNQKTLRRWFEFLPVRLWWGLTRPLPFETRAALWASLGRLLIALPLGPRRRVEKNLALIWPNLPEARRAEIIRAVGGNVTRGLSELLNNDQFQQRLTHFHPSGPGLDVLRAAKGKGAIIVSGHFGQWEAIRAVLQAEGLPTGAIYRDNNNGYYNDLFVRMTAEGGEPMFDSGPEGMRAMIKHLRSGGFVAILTDQKFRKGKDIPFLGHDALTSIAPAQLALKYGIPMVPAFGIRREDPNEIDIAFEAPIPPSDAETMTREINTRLSARVETHPGQWYWLHRRWGR